MENIIDAGVQNTIDKIKLKYDVENTERIFTGLLKLNSVIIPSVNNTYLIGRSRTKSWTYKNPEVNTFQDYFMQLASKTDLIKIKDIRDTIHSLEVDFTYMINYEFWKRDTSNMHKCTEDALSRVICVADSRNIKFTSRKVPIEDKKNEYIFVVIKCNFYGEEINYES